ncbi:MAG: ribonuclease III [Armatimonadota bacterium]|nr:ribonuclease III [Armatimonadota bacterium]
MPEERFASLKQRLGLQFVPDELLELAFRHSSYVREQGLDELASNQRLEYLGDAVLDLVFASYLYSAHAELPEGALTRMKAALVRKSALAAVARELGLGKYLLLGRGEETTGGRNKASLLADLVEALIGAIFLSGGFVAARDFVLEHFGTLLEDVHGRESLRDHKSALQEVLQACGETPPSYRVVRTEGPPHDRWFIVEATHEGGVIGVGEGRSKRAAEQEAAREALDTVEEWLSE